MSYVYLDHAATTPLRPEARAAMDAVLDCAHGNPSSAHRPGREARSELEHARSRIASALAVEPSEIVFVRGGTEGDNLAVLGRALAARQSGDDSPLVVTTAVEHKAVLEAAAVVERDGGRSVTLRVFEDGALDMAALERALQLRPALVSVMWVNNETGGVLPIEEVADLTSSAGVALHTDAVQAVGKVPVDLARVPVDLLTITGHKLGGPMGLAVLFVREGTQLAPLVHGGGQEQGLRPGTSDVAGAVGLATAIELAIAELSDFSVRVGSLRDALERGVLDAVPNSQAHGASGPRAPHLSNLGLPGADRGALVAALDLEGVAVSGGAACSSGASAPSPVIAALYGADHGLASVRYSLGRTTTAGDIEAALAATLTVMQRVSPVVSVP